MEVPESYLPLPPSTCEPLTTYPEIPGGTYKAGTVKAEAEEDEEMSVCGLSLSLSGPPFFMCDMSYYTRRIHIRICFHVRVYFRMIVVLHACVCDARLHANIT